jgi:hypothetical protein
LRLWTLKSLVPMSLAILPTSPSNSRTIAMYLWPSG